MRKDMVSMGWLVKWARGDGVGAAVSSPAAWSIVSERRGCGRGRTGQGQTRRLRGKRRRNVKPIRSTSGY